MSDIFISHKSRDAGRVRPLVEVLEAQDWDVWWSQDDIRTGADWSEKIEAALEESRCVVVVWSEESVSGDTDWVFSEAEAGRRAQKLAPLMLDPVELPKPFDRVQTADLTDWVPGTAHDGLERLVNGIAAILEARVDYRKLPRPGLPVAHAIVAAAGLLATLGPLLYIARTGPSPPTLYLLLSLVALAATAAGFSLLRGLFPWGILGFRSLRNLKPAVALAAALLFGAAAGFVGLLLSASGTPIEVAFRTAGEPACPADLADAGARFDLGDGARRELALGGDCRARFRLRPDVVATARASVSLDPASGFVVARPFVKHALADLEIVVEVVCDTETPRSRLSMLEYLGGSETALEQFQGVLVDKLETLKEQLDDELGEDAEHELANAQLRALKLQAIDGVSPGSDDERLDYLKRTHSLGLLSGTVLESDGVEVKSRVFVGEAADRGSSFPLTTRVSGEEFNQARDGHAATFLYALAMEARRLDAPDQLVMAYLSQATELVTNLEVEEIRRLQQRIDAASEEIKRGEEPR